MRKSWQAARFGGRTSVAEHLPVDTRIEDSAATSSGHEDARGTDSGYEQDQPSRDTHRTLPSHRSALRRTSGASAAAWRLSSLA